MAWGSMLWVGAVGGRRHEALRSDLYRLAALRTVGLQDAAPVLGFCSFSRCCGGRGRRSAGGDGGDDGAGEDGGDGGDLVHGDAGSAGADGRPPRRQTPLTPLHMRLCGNFATARHNFLRNLLRDVI
jgi:hypothetical protein